MLFRSSRDLPTDGSPSVRQLSCFRSGCASLLTLAHSWQTTLTTPANKFREAARHSQEAERVGTRRVQLWSAGSIARPVPRTYKLMACALPGSHAFSPRFVGSQRTCIQHPRSDHGNTLHVVCGVLLFRERGARHVRSLRTGEPHLHSFHEPHQTLCRCATF